MTAAQVSLDEIEETGRAKAAGGKELEPLQRVGFQLAIVVFGAIVVGTVGIALVSFVGTAATPVPTLTGPPSADGLAAYQQAVELYQRLGDVQLARATSLFQLVIVTALLPSFTAILGYIFGTRTGESG